MDKSRLNTVNLFNPEAQSAPAQGQSQSYAMDESSLGESLLVGLGSGFNRFGQEVAGLATAAGEGVGLLPEGATQERLQATQAERAAFDQTPVGQSTAGSVGQFVGEVLPTVVIPGGVVGGTLRRIGTGAAAGAASGFLQPTQDSESVLNQERIINTLAGTILGGAIPGLQQGIKRFAGTAKEGVDLFTKRGGSRMVKQGLLDSANPEAIVNPTEAARRLKTWVSPGEATNFRELVAREQGMKLDEELMSSLGVQLRNRDKVVNTSIKQLINDIAPDTPQRAQVIQEGYDALLQTKMSPKLMGQIQKDKLLGPEFKKFIKAKGYREELADLPKDSAAILDRFQAYLGESKDKLFKSGKGRAGKAVNDRRQDLRNLLDITVPEYAVARREAQLNNTRRAMEKGLSTIKGIARDEIGDPVSTPVQFYQKFFKAEKDFDDLIRNLGDSHGAVQKAKDLRVVLSSLEGSPLEKVFSTREPLSTIRTGGFGPLGTVFFETISKLRGRYNQGMIEAITDPALADDVLAEAAKLARKGDKKSLERAVSELSQVVAKTQAKLSTDQPGPAPIEQQEPQRQQNPGDLQSIFRGE